jgi:hypothetical protein
MSAAVPLSRRGRAFAQRQSSKSGPGWGLVKRIIKAAVVGTDDTPKFLRKVDNFLGEESGVAPARRVLSGKGGAWDAVAMAGLLPVGRMGRLAKLAGKNPLGSTTLAMQAESATPVKFGDRSLFKDLFDDAKPAPGDAKFRRGRLYRTGDTAPNTPGDLMDRVPMITDPGTGVSFMGRTVDDHHEQVERAATQLGYRLTPEQKWLQHEVFDAFPSRQIPATIRWSVYSDGPAAGVMGRFGGSWAGDPSRASAFAQARILQQLRKRGRRGYTQ